MKFMSTDGQIEFLESLKEARIEAGQCIYCGSDEDTEDNPMVETVLEDNTVWLEHKYCTVMTNYPTQDDFDKEEV